MIIKTCNFDRTGGYFYISNSYKSNVLDDKKVKNLFRMLKFGSTILYIPESTIQTNINKKYFKFIKDSYVTRHQEVFPNYFTNIKGFIDFELERQIKYITINIKPGERYLLKEKKKYFLHINEQVYFPGELVLNKFEIKLLSYLEIINRNNQLYLFITCPMLLGIQFKEFQVFDYKIITF